MNAGNTDDDPDLPPLPPPGPPPLLTPDEIRHLAHQGWLSLDLAPDFLQDIIALFAAGDQFFSLGAAEKSALYPARHGTELGFYTVPGEKEYLTIRRRAVGSRDAPDPLADDLEAAAARVWHRAAVLLHRILGDLARATGLPGNVWDPIVAGTLTLPPPSAVFTEDISLLRLFRYEPCGDNSAATTSSGALPSPSPPHVDVGLLTLCIGRAAGLQVLDSSCAGPRRHFLDAPGPIVLVGDAARALLRKRVRAGLHRVVGNPAGRDSIVMALRPCLRATREDLARFGVVDEDDDAGDTAGGGAGDMREYFYRIKGEKYNINATMDVRASQRKANLQGRAMGHG